MMPREPKPTFKPEYIRDLSEKVYRIRLEDASGKGAAERMIEKDQDAGEKLRRRAGAYDALTRAYLEAFGVRP